MFGQALQTHPGLGWLTMLGAAARGTGVAERKGLFGRRAKPHPQMPEVATILFADICGSMPLYQAAGDRIALEVVARCIDSLAAIAREAGGTIIRSKGDDLLCTFSSSESALMAARQMTSAQRKSQARVRVALHHGELIRARGDIFGDAVNLAARVLGLGKADEVLATGEVYDKLTGLDRGSLRRIGEHTLKGSRDAVCLYAALPLDSTDSTTLRNLATETLTLDTCERSPIPATVVEIQCGDERRHCAEGESIRIGRAPYCDMVVPLSWVSREHATLSVHQGKLTLKDHSSTGTHVRLADGHEFSVRRETIVLSGAGAITPGGRHVDDAAMAVQFSIGQAAAEHA